MSKLLDEPKIRQLLSELDSEVSEHIAVELVLVGGAALALGWKFRSTGDLDIISSNIPPEVRRAIEVIGERNGLSADWMNDAAKINIPNVHTLPADLMPLYEGKRIRVLIPSAKFLLAMKLFSARERDINDCAFLLQQTEIATLDELLDLIQQGYQSARIPAKCQYFAQKVLDKVGR